ncbi:MAG TPA: metabolite traffic protein EboE [Pedobacter sp.]|uniref:metabolite traffic protein EboE n=1 Tax=Pedobacter sp. TaxID=1411316 RepID=UPI002C2C0D99|nr:metabolite traffic protein EboE [Pedobacter sp.]HMI03584.1 metabolite traffic protein EboE [Pedobacter sp.]
MKVNSGHLTYCTNIHAGKNWTEDFKALQKNFPAIKQSVSPDQPMGLGLRLSNEASLALANQATLDEFKQWLKDNDTYVFTMNGFPYGEFHHTVVKADVHTPDWTTDARREYSIRLFRILEQLLPEGMDGGVSTNPLSYRHWFKTDNALNEARRTGTMNMIEVVKELISIYNKTGKVLHLDVEPEPDGMMETGREFIDWFEADLLTLGIPEISKVFAADKAAAEKMIRRHLNLCYDVCHFAIGYEPHEAVLKELAQKNIAVGKIQISAALKANLQKTAEEKAAIKKAFDIFNEPVYLHQVVARKADRDLLRYTDLPEALADFENETVQEWRAHFHVPISIKEIGLLSTTQEDITEVLRLQKNNPFTHHLEIETYTWEVLPQQIKLPITESISKELDWVISQLA